MSGVYERTPPETPGAFPVLSSKGAKAQQRIEAVPDEIWVWTRAGEPPILEKAGYLLVTAGQRTSTARLTAVASSERYVGQGWMPVTGVSVLQAKAAAVFINATPGRLLLASTPSKTLSFPGYVPDTYLNFPIPDMSDQHIIDTLAACWEETRNVIVPQFRDGYTEVRQRWDAAVCDALGWDINEISELGKLLAEEPRVRGQGLGQWKA